MYVWWLSGSLIKATLQGTTEYWKYNNAKHSIPAHPTLSNDAYRDINLRPVTSKISGVHPLTMVIMSAKSDE